MQLQNKKEWDYNLPSVLFALNNTVNRHTGLSPHHIIFGRSARIPIDNVAGKVVAQRPLNEVVADIWRSQQFATEKALRIKEDNDYRASLRRPVQQNVTTITPGTVVFWQKKNLSAGQGSLAPRFYGPYKVLHCDQFTALLQHLDTGDCPPHRVNLEQLKLFHFNPDYMDHPRFSRDNLYRARPNRHVMPEPPGPPEAT